MSESPQTFWPRRWRQALEQNRYAHLLPEADAIVQAGGVSGIRLYDASLSAYIAYPDGRREQAKVTLQRFQYHHSRYLHTLYSSNDAQLQLLSQGHIDPSFDDTLRYLYGLDVCSFNWNYIYCYVNDQHQSAPNAGIMALLVRIGQELAHSSYILFELHGSNLCEELREKGLTINCVEGNTPYYNTVGLVSGGYELPRQVDRFRLDLSRIEDKNLLYGRILTERPSFYPQGDFREVYLHHLHTIQRRLRNLMCGKLKIANVWKGKRFQGLLPYDARMESRLLGDHWDQHVPRLLRIHPDSLFSYSNDVVFHWNALHLAIDLILKGHVYPDSVDMRYHQRHIYWKAAGYDSNVNDTILQLERMAPSNRVVLDPVPCASWKKPQAVQQPAYWTTTCYIEVLMRRLSSCTSKDDWLTRYFFREQSILFRFDSKKIGDDIHDWVENLRLFGSQYYPIIRIEEADEAGSFDISFLLADSLCPNDPPCTFPEVCERYRDAFHPIRIFRALNRIAPEMFQRPDEQDEQVVFSPLHLSGGPFLHYLLEVIPSVRRYGVKVEMPKALADLCKPKRTVRIKKRTESEGQLSMQDLLDFDWQVALGNRVVPYGEFQQMVNQQERSLLKVDDQYVLVSPADLKRMHDLCAGKEAEQEDIAGNLLLQAALMDEYDEAPIALTDEVRQLIKEMTEQVEIPLPQGLQATMRPYQERGYSWLYRNMRIGFGSILADDMGLGKTLQTLAFLLKLKEEGRLEEKKALIVVPASLMHNWQAEMERFTPSLTCQLYHGNARHLSRFNADLLITTYGLARTNLERLKAMPWRVMVIDEAQNIKNHSSLQSRAIRSIPADTHIALSGTPVENRMSEYWSIMDYANHGYLGSLRSFSERYISPIQHDKDEAMAERFRRITAPFMMRRMKTDKSIIADLPDKIEQNERASLLPDQAALYQTVLNEAIRQIEQTSPEDGGIQRKGLILQMILHLKQVCDHPALYLKDSNLSPSRSGKTELLLTLVDSVLDTGDKMLIFTQFKTMAEYLQQILHKHTGRAPLLLHGSLSLEERQEVVRRFQEEAEERLLVLSLKAAGTGLNLTAASHVVHYDLWWNPAVESQATDRAYRIGQRRNVVVHRLITHSTFEERIDKIIQDKRALAERTVASGEGWIANLTNDELREIFKTD